MFDFSKPPISVPFSPHLGSSVPELSLISLPHEPEIAEAALVSGIPSFATPKLKVMATPSKKPETTGNSRPQGAAYTFLENKLTCRPIEAVSNETRLLKKTKHTLPCLPQDVVTPALQVKTYDGPVIDHHSFPHIVLAILHYAPYDSLRRLGPTCSRYRDLVEAQDVHLVFLKGQAFPRCVSGNANALSSRLVSLTSVFMNANVTFMNDNIETLAHLPFAASCSAPTPFLPGSLRVIDIIDRSSLSSASPGATAFPLRPWVARIRPSTSVGTIKIEPECLVIFDWSPPIPHSFSGLQYIKAIKVYSVSYNRRIHIAFLAPKLDDLTIIFSSLPPYNRKSLPNNACNSLPLVINDLVIQACEEWNMGRTKVKITFVGIDQLYPRFALEVVNSGIAKMGISRAEWWTFPNFATKAAACSNLQTLVWYLRLYKFPALPPDAFQFLSHHDYRVLVGIKQYNLETIDTFSFKSGSST